MDRNQEFMTGRAASSGGYENPHPLRILAAILILGLFPGVNTGLGQTSSLLKFPWIGGFNSCQFCAIDLDLDGRDDLLVFDRHGNRKLTFINHGAPNTSDYTYDPGYITRFPDLHDWVIAADYNCDGKKDLFTYGLGGIRVFRNISDTELRFTQVTGMLESWYYHGYVGILVTTVDYPAIADIDGDGDLDLLTFFGLGSYLEYHKNLSVEKYGNCDSLDYRLTDHCWGKFRESEGGNRITLNAICPYLDEGMTAVSEEEKPRERHTGSTLLATDLNDDGLMDLILGDVDFPGLIALTNGGTTDTALMVAQDTLFPSYSAPVKLFSFPSAAFLDMDNDNRSDLVVSPFDPAYYTADNAKSIWFYKNTGSAAIPWFGFVSDRFFLSETIDFGSASSPVLYDLDNDGLEDLLAGNYGYYDSSYQHQGILHSVYTSRIAFFKNTGYQLHPVFQSITNDLAGISALGLVGCYPAPGDLNGDGKTDLLTGNSDGTLLFFPGTGETVVPPVFGPPQRFYQQIDVGEFSAPCLFDLNQDGLKDLIIGERGGNLNYYRNTGTADTPVFTFITDSLGKINVTNYQVSYDGYSTPCFFRVPGGVTRLIAGSDEGRLHFYDSIDGNLDGKFRASGSINALTGTLQTDTIPGWRTAAAVAHLTDPVQYDLIAGNFAGGLNYFSARQPAQIIPSVPETVTDAGLHLVIYPNPADREAVIELAVKDQRSVTGDGKPGNRLISFSGNSAGYLEITDILGRTLMYRPFTGRLVAATASFSDGIYLVRTAGISARLIIRHP